MKKRHKILLWLNLFLILLTILAYLSPYIDPGKTYIFSFFGLVYPWLLLANILMVMLWLAIKAKFSLFSVATIILGWYFINGIVNFSKNKYNLHPQNNFAVGSYNMQYAYSLYAMNPNFGSKSVEEYESFLDTFKHVDVLCIQETQKATREFIDHRLDFAYQHSIEGRGAAIYTNFPIIHKGEIDFGTVTNSCLWADIAIRDDTFRVYSVHLQSNRITDETEQVVNTGGFGDSETWTGIKGILAKYRTYVKRRSEQVKILYQHKSESPYRAIICGDLNDPPQSFVYRYLMQDMKDSFKERGNGIGATYAGIIPGLRIDYIFTDRSLEIQDHRVIREKFSDHFPIVSTIVLP